MRRKSSSDPIYERYKDADFSRAKRGPVIASPGKTRISIMIDDVVLDAFRSLAEASGIGYQTVMNQALKQYLDKTAQPLDEPTIRRIIREELKQAG